jgi:hypothetical protein
MTVIANCTLYLPVEQPDFTKSLPPGKLRKGFIGPPKEFTFSTPEAEVLLNLRHPDLPAHLNGFRGYVGQLPDADDVKRAAIARIATVKTAIGVMLSQPIPLEGQTFTALKSFAFAHRGFIFVQNSMLTETGYLVGPEATGVFTTPATSIHVDIPDYAANASPEARAIRERTMAELKAAGFRPAANLPHPNPQAILRPKEELAGRFCALLDLFLFVAAPEDAVPEAGLRQAISSHHLARFLTEDERDILSLSRADANDEHVGSIGWRLENMLPLAWILGMEPKPSLAGEMAGGDEIAAMRALLPPPGASWPAWLDSLALRGAAEVIALQDLFYCAHNAVRSAQTGHKTVPEGFHPVGNGGVIHERRHALTWALSPRVEWDDTDLST